VTYKCWIATDRTTLDTKVKHVEEFVDLLLAHLTKLQKHNFIAKQQQSSFLKQMKTPTMEYVLVIEDFTENYSLSYKMLLRVFIGPTRKPRYILL